MVSGSDYYEYASRSSGSKSSTSSSCAWHCSTASFAFCPYAHAISTQQPFDTGPRQRGASRARGLFPSGFSIPHFLRPRDLSCPTARVFFPVPPHQASPALCQSCACRLIRGSHHKRGRQTTDADLKEERGGVRNTLKTRPEDEHEERSESPRCLPVHAAGKQEHCRGQQRLLMSVGLAD